MSALDAVREAETRASMIGQTVYIVRYGTGLRTMTHAEVMASGREGDVLEAVHP